MRLAFDFSLSFAKDYFKNLGSISGHLIGHKYWELEHYYYTNDVINFELGFTTKRDHAGFQFTIGLLGYSINFQIYDNRHWNDEHDSWIDMTG